MKFTKMEGCGNDYIYINCLQEYVNEDLRPELARKLSDRHYGIGSDGIIFIDPSDIADFSMDMYNSDGSRSAMCGNGIRCVGRFVYDKGLADKLHLNISSHGLIRHLTLNVNESIIRDSHDTKPNIMDITVDMGTPIMDASYIPVITKRESAINEDITIHIGESKITYRYTAISMGNPHAIIFVDNVNDIDIDTIGPRLECHEYFPEKANIEFVEVVDKSTIKMRVWERGSGETLACGTGACASVVASVLNGHTINTVDVLLLGGHLNIKWDQITNSVYMTGPATTVYEGEIFI